MEPLHLLLAAALPSAERRIATEAMEAATRRAMGVTAKSGVKIPLLASEGLWRRVEQDIATVKNMKPGWRKSLNEFFMHEGPTSVLYLPSEHGMRIGETLGKVTKSLPTGARENIANLISLDPEKAQAALSRYSGVIDQAQALAAKLPMGDVSADGIERALKLTNQAADVVTPVAEFVRENPLPTALLATGIGAVALDGLHKSAFIRGFENAVQK
jgi:hypothetical protein